MIFTTWRVIYHEDIFPYTYSVALTLPRSVYLVYVYISWSRALARIHPWIHWGRARLLVHWWLLDPGITNCMGRIIVNMSLYYSTDGLLVFFSTRCLLGFSCWPLRKPLIQSASCRPHLMIYLNCESEAEFSLISDFCSCLAWAYFEKWRKVSSRDYSIHSLASKGWWFCRGKCRSARR